MTTSRRLLVTSALPYANGHIHIGHLVEYIQTDIWVRFQKLRGHNCRYFCADDTHGTAIMIRARQEGRSEEEVIADMRTAHMADFAKFGVEFDNYGSTNSEENRLQCHEFWKEIRAAGLVREKEIEQLFDPVANTFLADRFVKGTCPVCKSPNQYGDNCDKCGSTYTPADLIDPKSTLSGATPELRKALHLFVEIEQLHKFLEEWTQTSGALQSEIANYLKGHFLGEPLRDWDISRPAPYFGFEIPDAIGNYWYVWFDAPIGYIASTWEWCKRNGENLADWWQSTGTEIHHFIGKDITYFHTLFWPAMLKTAGHSLPTKVHIHGFLTVDGEKMSKSKGTFVQAATYAKHLDPSYLRYFYASKLSNRVDDIDLNFEEFKTKVDSDLVGKVVNIASRCAKFVAKQSLAAAYPDDGGLFAQAAAVGEKIAELYESCDYNAAMREVMVLADRANQYIEAKEPWKVAKDPARSEELRDICTVGLNLFRQLAFYLAPVLPELKRQTEALLNSPITSWNDAQTPLTGTAVSEYQHMLKRVDPKQVEKMIEESKDSAAPASAPEPASPWNDGPEPLLKEPLTGEHCTIDDFMKIDMRVARVVEAGHVEGADKLIQLKLSLGGTETRNVFAGIKSCYKPEDLVGRLVICCSNLAPRKMRFGVSEGMVLACGPGGKEIFLLNPDDGAKPGMRVH
ncbi:methionine--tRNA ligase [Planctomicrobium piriforme]|uniref:Methionine--tRNA ligase n=1 Tax=Planctomicrobium piriforme TaxID=1576369 RepID=A0A1I3AXV7_9PLAN|nr:methionine--tRNA ligase [Planctomicrobium piriforme]SFH54948.1 methionyl-tRNA synthetase [Planctomicrobium piriforme]